MMRRIALDSLKHVVPNRVGIQAPTAAEFSRALQSFKRDSATQGSGGGFSHNLVAQSHQSSELTRDGLSLRGKARIGTGQAGPDYGVNPQPYARLAAFRPDDTIGSPWSGATNGSSPIEVGTPQSKTVDSSKSSSEGLDPPPKTGGGTDSLRQLLAKLVADLQKLEMTAGLDGAGQSKSPLDPSRVGGSADSLQQIVARLVADLEKLVGPGGAGQSQPPLDLSKAAADNTGNVDPTSAGGNGGDSLQQIVARLVADLEKLAGPGGAGQSQPPLDLSKAAADNTGNVDPTSAGGNGSDSLQQIVARLVADLEKLAGPDGAGQSQPPLDLSKAAADNTGNLDPTSAGGKGGDSLQQIIARLVADLEKLAGPGGTGQSQPPLDPSKAATDNTGNVDPTSAGGSGGDSLQQIVARLVAELEKLAGPGGTGQSQPPLDPSKAATDNTGNVDPTSAGGSGGDSLQQIVARLVAELEKLAGPDGAGQSQPPLGKSTAGAPTDGPSPQNPPASSVSKVADTSKGAPGSPGGLEMDPSKVKGPTSGSGPDITIVKNGFDHPITLNEITSKNSKLEVEASVTLQPGQSGVLKHPDGESDYIAKADPSGQIKSSASRLEEFSDPNGKMNWDNVSDIDDRDAAISVTDGKGFTKGDARSIADGAPAGTVTTDSAGDKTIAGYYDGSAAKMREGSDYMIKELGTKGAYQRPQDDTLPAAENPMSGTQSKVISAEYRPA